MPLEVGTKLGPYDIVAPIGAGGMGEVYRARDTRLDREVAVKVLTEQLATDSDALRRFEREAKAVAALSHPNVLVIYDVGHESGRSFIVTELLQGETLRDRLQRSPLPWTEAVPMALAIARGLIAAHAHGIVHRDLKPGNLFLTIDGILKILDFGLARVVERPVDASDSTVTLVTKPGRMLGTLHYMSPEQVRGQSIDIRTDIFSFGCVLFEMVAGTRVFNGETAADVITAILTQGSPSVSESQTGIPAELDRVITRCLEKEPANRYETAAALHQDLERLRPQASSTTATALAVPLELPSRPSLAVLPFENVGSDPEQDYFALGLWADINADLIKISGLFLVSQVSTGLYKGKSASPEEVGRELGVRYVLQGNVRRAGDHVRITTQLVDTQTGESTWAERYDGRLDDVFALQDRITDEIVQALDIKLVRGEGHRIIGRSIRSPRARDIYYRALAALFSFRREDIAEARCLLSEAEQLEPDSPLTHVFAAVGLYFEAALGYCERPEEVLDEAMVVADRAIELEDPTGTAHMIKGFIQLRRRQHEAALESSEQAIGSRPSCPWAYALQGSVQNYSDNPAEGIDMARLAIRHTPIVPPVFPAVLATAHYLLGQHGEAVHAARSTIRLAPDTLEVSVLLAAALAAGGHPIEAEPVVKEIYRINASFTLDAYARSQPYRIRNTLDGLLVDLRAAGLS